MGGEVFGSKQAFFFSRDKNKEDGASQLLGILFEEGGLVH